MLGYLVSINVIGASCAQNGPVLRDFLLHEEGQTRVEGRLYKKGLGRHASWRDNIQSIHSQQDRHLLLLLIRPLLLIANS